MRFSKVRVRSDVEVPAASVPMKKGGLGDGELALRKATDGKLMWASPGNGIKKRLIRKLI